MIIRHAEKHTNDTAGRSVNIEGAHAKHELTVRGWLRAGALVPFFAHPSGLPEGAPISTPRSIFASGPSKQSPSLRPKHTVLPLAVRLGIPIDTSHVCGQEASVAAAALQAPGPVLIAWHHSHIRDIARSIAGDSIAYPELWPDDRFDVVWILDRPDAAAGPWTFSQLPQRLLHNDRAEPI